MMKPHMQDIKHDLTSMGDECNCPMDRIFFGTTLLGNWDSLIAQLVKNPPAMQETPVLFLGWDDLLKKG